MLRLLLSVMLMLLAFPSVVLAKASAPTFYCAKATHVAEKFICNDASLMNLDHQMAKTYKESLDRASKLDAGADEAVKLLKATQHGWVRGRNDCWKEQGDARIKSCVEKAYKERISKLHIQFRLSPIDTTQNFICPDRSEIIISFFNSTLILGAIIEYGDESQIYLLSSQNTDEKNYEGDFGARFKLAHDDGFFTLDQFKPELKCQLKKTSAK